MAQPNSILLTSATRLAPSTARGHSRSPSRSPTRRAEFTAHELDPLLGNLSPTSTLEALSLTAAVQPGGKKEQDVLARSITQASTTERALGIRAALAAQKLREWYTEVSAWPWPDRKAARLGKGFQTPDNDSKEEHIGSLPSSILDAYEDRVDEIRDGMEALEVEELKEHVLNAHVSSRSRPSSSNGQTMGNPHALDYTELRDFTAVITATILQALPVLSRLNMLLGTWDMRSLVLRQIPGLLRGLSTTRDAIEAAWSAVSSNDAESYFSKEDYHHIRDDLEARVSSLGSKVDQILDALEGREDVLPEAWIDEMDGIEADFGNWVVEAGRALLQQDLNARQEESTRSVVAPMAMIETIRSALNPQSVEDSDTQPIEPEAIEASGSNETVGSSGRSLPEAPMPALDGMPKQSTSPMLNPLEDLPPLPLTPVRAEPPQSIIASPAPEWLPESASVVEGADSKRDSVLSTSRDESSGTGRSTKEPLPLHPGGPTDPLPTPPASETQEVANKYELPSTSSTTKELNLTGKAGLDTFPASGQETGVIANEEKASPTALPSELPAIKAGVMSDKGDASAGRPQDGLSEYERLANKEPSSELATSYPLSTAETEFVRTSTSPEREEDFHSALPDSVTVLDWEYVVTPTNLEVLQKGLPVPSSAGISFLESASQEQTKQGRRPPPLDLSSANTHKRSTSALSALSSGVSDYLSDLSTPEILDASTAEVHSTPVVVDSPYRAMDKDYFSTSRPSSASQKPRTRSMYMSGEMITPTLPKQSKHTRATSVPMASLILGPEPAGEVVEDEDLQGDEGDEEDNANFREPPPMIKRASFASIGSLPKSELKTITVNRAGSPASLLSNQSKQKTQDSVKEAFGALTGSESKNNSGASIEAPLVSPLRTRSLEQRFPQRPSHEEDPPLLRVVTRPKFPTQDAKLAASPPLPRKSSKRTSRNLNFSTSPSTPPRGKKQTSPQNPASTSTPTKPSVSRTTEATKSLPLKSNEETLEEKIHDLLTTIPARIHLASAPVARPDRISPKFGSRSKEKEKDSSKDTDSLSTHSNSNTPSSRDTTPTPSLTLTPMRPSRSGPLARTSDDPSIALYHLSRSGPGGKDATPIKLFVRLVGQNPERVMVRVGGGWADLGEYLREYALHHGRRAVSDGRFDVQGLPSQNSSPAGPVPTSRTPSGFLGSIKRRSPASSRPASALEFRPKSALEVHDSRRGSATPSELSYPSSPSSPIGTATSDFATPPPVPSIPSRHRKSSLSSVMTPTRTTSFTFPTTTTTTTSTSGSNSPPSITHTRTTSGYTPLGAAGPRSQSRTVSALNPENEAWVEGVVGQARRTTSARTDSSPATSTPGSAGRNFNGKESKEQVTPGSV